MHDRSIDGITLIGSTFCRRKELHMAKGITVDLVQIEKSFLNLLDIEMNE